MVLIVGVDCTLVVGGGTTMMGEPLGVPIRIFTGDAVGGFMGVVTGVVTGGFTGDLEATAGIGKVIGDDDVGNNGGGVNPTTSGFGPSMMTPAGVPTV